MPKYQCPECEAVLRRENPIPEGKKIKCPKCEVVFKAEPLRDADETASAPKKPKTPAKPAPLKAAPAKPAPADDDDDELGGSYSMAEEKVETDETGKKKKKKEVDYGSLRDKYEKSYRGPAMARMVGLSNRMLMFGALLAICAVFGVMGFLWPFIFSDEPPTGRSAREEIIKICASALAFAYGGCMCYGASKLHDLSNFGWSIAGSIMTVINGLLLAILSLIKLGAVIIAMNSDPTKDPPKAENPDHKVLQGKAISSDLKEIRVESGNKKETVVTINAATEYVKGRKSAKLKDLRDGGAVKIFYAEESNQLIAKKVTIDPDDDGDDSGMLPLFLLLYGGTLAWGVVACQVGAKSLKLLKDDDIKAGYEETKGAIDY